ncbi:unnamed protein product [Meganyctiphanes norvegica]|uniref:Arrestin C-terminal-like domain-containing protein n=1 Tax=Meganyctiphanes norvegica TaxID=48144 RepID=A0AAV2QSF0_MEGNR
MSRENIQLSNSGSMMVPNSKFKVFRKASPNDKICIYMFDRSYVDTATEPPVVNGIIKVDPNYVADRNVYMQMVIIFGRKEEKADDGDFEHQFSTKKLYLDCHQIYPITRNMTPTQAQEDLVSKLGTFAIPFRMEFPKLGGPSYQMMQGYKDDQANLGLEYEVMAFVGKDEWDDHKRSSSRIAVWRIQGLPPTLNRDGPKPKGHKTKHFIMMNGSVHIDVLLNKNLYKTEEEITVYVNVMNDCNREVQHIKVKLVQRDSIPMFIHDGDHDLTIQKIDDKVHIPHGGKLTRDYTLTTSLPQRVSHGHVMLEGTIGRDSKEVLASSTHMNQAIPKADIYGIYVEYIVKVKVCFGKMLGDTTCEVPFILTQN